VDAFSLFDLERRPVISEPALKEKYLQMAADRHPDTSGGDDEDFHLVQEAYKILRDPTARLRHLLDLQFPGQRKDGGHAPHAELFMRAGNAVQAARAVSQRLDSASSTLARALLSPEIAAALRQIREAFAAVQKADDELTAQLEDLDRRWPEISPEELSGLASSFKFLSRWKSQLSEWEFRLSSG
jgi:curved DNA-binding protein CbpA